MPSGTAGRGCWPWRASARRTARSPRAASPSARACRRRRRATASRTDPAARPSAGPEQFPSRSPARGPSPPPAASCAAARSGGWCRRGGCRSPSARRRGSGEAFAVDVGAVGGAAVSEFEGAVGGADDGVAAGDARVVERDVCFFAAERQLALDREPFPAPGPSAITSVGGAGGRSAERMVSPRRMRSPSARRRGWVRRSPLT